MRGFPIAPLRCKRELDPAATMLNVGSEGHDDTEGPAAEIDAPEVSSSAAYQVAQEARRSTSKTVLLLQLRIRILKRSLNCRRGERRLVRFPDLVVYSLVGRGTAVEGCGATSFIQHGDRLHCCRRVADPDFGQHLPWHIRTRLKGFLCR